MSTLERYRAMYALQTAKHAKVVVIDNDESTCHSLKSIIQSSGHEVYTYESGLQYLDAAVHFERPDCIVLDIHMPEISGLELYGIIKTQHPDIPIIFITGFPDMIMAKKAHKLESQRFFTKPLDTDALLDCIDNAVVVSVSR